MKHVYNVSLYEDVNMYADTIQQWFTKNIRITFQRVFCLSRNSLI